MSSRKLCKRIMKLAQGVRFHPSSNEFAKAIDGIADQVIREFGLEFAIDESEFKEFIEQMAIEIFWDEKDDDDALAERIDR